MAIVHFVRAYSLSQSNTLSVKLFLSFFTLFWVSTHPVDDFGLKGTDDAAVVEDRVFCVQLFEGCSGLRGEQRPVVIAAQSTVCSVCVCVFPCNHLAVTRSCVCVDTMLQA